MCPRYRAIAGFGFLKTWNLKLGTWNLKHRDLPVSQDKTNPIARIDGF